VTYAWLPYAKKSRRRARREGGGLVVGPVATTILQLGVAVLRDVPSTPEITKTPHHAMNERISRQASRVWFQIRRQELNIEGATLKARTCSMLRIFVSFMSITMPDDRAT
jgi:hypothetical protein